MFFNISTGRLKLRILRPDHGELIYYERADEAAARLSSYSIFVTREPRVLQEVLTRALGGRAVVRKRRELYLVGQTRIHLDTVESLGGTPTSRFPTHWGAGDRVVEPNRTANGASSSGSARIL